MRFSSGQSVFLIIVLLISFFFDFYLGARFGPELFWGIPSDRRGSAPLLPEEVDDSELEALLSEEADPMVFHEVLEGKKVVGVKDLSSHSDLPDEVYEVKEVNSPKVKEIKTTEDKKELVDGDKVLSINKKGEEAKQKTEKVDEIKEGIYSLQVGSFSEIYKANQVLSEFKTRGWGPFIKEVTIPDKGKWYRVYVGNYPTKDEALVEKDRIYETLKVMPIVVKLNQ